MDEKKLLKVAVSASLIGVMLLFFISKLVIIPPMTINIIDQAQIGKTVQVKGTITSISSGDSITSIYLDNSDTASVVFSNIELEKGDEVKITGKVDEYNGNLQVVVDKVEIG